MRRLDLVGALLLMLLAPAWTTAQETTADPFPTIAALNAAVVPHRDQVDLARRLNGVTEIAPPPINPEPLALGTVKTFWVDDTSDFGSFQVDAELRAVGEHIYIWVERGANLPQDGLDRLAEDFDTLVYDKVRELWGSEASPGVDGDPRVHGLFASNLGPGVGAYYAGKHSNPVEAVPTSNEHEMFFFNLDTIDYLVGDFAVTSITAHEFQHMIRANVDPNEDGWMDEGFSEFTQLYLEDPGLFSAYAFLDRPGTQLNTWTEDGSRAADYGASLLWVTYLYERFGLEGLQQLSKDPANGMVAVDNLAAQFGTDANTLFADWVLANLLVNPATTAERIYGYTSFLTLPGPNVTTYYSTPIQERLTISQYATQYVALNELTGVEQLFIEVNSNETVGLAPTTSPSNTPMWYSNRGDDSNTHLTLPINLTGMINPVLSFDLWYHIEDLWDYGYVMASTDGGATWDILQTPEMTTENPYFNAYGPGYSGESGGGAVSQWVTEAISLADYADQEILLRFEMIYDDAVNQPGMFIDYVRVFDEGRGEEYFTDFDDPAMMANWEAAGWVLTDNRLPQQVWVQAVQRQGSTDVVTRWLVDGGHGAFVLPIDATTNNVVVALSPFAPVTTVPAQLTLNIRAE